MRSTVDLLELPYTFAMNRPLTPHKFRSELSDRGINVSREGLETLHRLRLLVPLLRVRRDGRVIAGAFRRDSDRAWQFANWQPTSRADLDEAAAAERLFDPAAEHFISRDRRTRTLGDMSYESSVYLYSAQQLTHVPILTDALPWLTRRRGPGSGKYNNWRRIWIDRWAEESRWYRDIATAVLALEPLYRPTLTGLLRLEWGHDAQEYYKWRDTLPPTQMLRWLGVEPQWLRGAAERLLLTAEARDSLGPWAELLPHADPRQWEKLRGTARTALELRLAAEILLRYYERLVKAHRAKPLPEPPTQFRDVIYDRRFGRLRPVDAVLTSFGLSPHPRLVLVVEGATEGLIFPRVMQFFGIRTDEDFISVQDAEGLGRRLEPLVAYLAPRLGKELEDRYVELVRPPTRLLEVVDAEGPVATAAQREKRRQKLLDRLLRTLPREYRQDPERLAHMRGQFDGLVRTTTWRRTGESFEFAHFTDRQIGQAIQVVDSRARQPTLDEWVRAVERVRADRGNLKAILGDVGKPELADELWPVLEKRLSEAQRRGTERRIPIVRVLDEALRIAHEWPRRGIVLSLAERR
jgi:hypothetical protein